MVKKNLVRPAETMPAAEKLGGLLVRQPDLIIPPRLINTADGESRLDPGGSIARWQLPGRGIVQYTIFNGINTRVESDGLPIAAAFASLPENQQPTVNFFDYRGFGESKGISLPELRFGQMRADARAALDATTAPQIIISISMGGPLAILRAQKEYELNQRYHAPRKALAIVAVNSAWNFTELDGIEAKSRLMMLSLMRDQPNAKGLSNDVTQAFLREAKNHLLRETQSPHGIIQPVIGCPILVIQGGRDHLIPSDHSERLVRNLAAPAKLFLPLADLEHHPSVDAIKGLIKGDITINGKGVTPVQWLQESLRPDRGWIVRHHVVPNVAPTVQQASVETASSLWQLAARAVTAAGGGIARAARSERALQLRQKVSARWHHAGQSIVEKLLPPRPVEQPPAANDDGETIRRRRHPPSLPHGGTPHRSLD